MGRQGVPNTRNRPSGPRHKHGLARASASCHIVILDLLRRYRGLAVAQAPRRVLRHHDGDVLIAVAACRLCRYVWSSGLEGSFFFCREGCPLAGKTGHADAPAHVVLDKSMPTRRCFGQALRASPRRSNARAICAKDCFVFMHKPRFPKEGKKTPCNTRQTLKLRNAKASGLLLDAKTKTSTSSFQAIYKPTVNYVAKPLKVA